MVRWLAPFLSFTCEEAWKSRGNIESIHLQDFLSAKESYFNSDINDKWNLAKQIRKVVTGALEKKRVEKVIGSSLEAHIDIYLEDKILNKLQGIDFTEIAITSSVTISKKEKEKKGFSLEDVKNVSVVVSKTSGHKCQRCWKYNDKLTNNEICNRCYEAIS